MFPHPVSITNNKVATERLSTLTLLYGTLVGYGMLLFVKLLSTLNCDQLTNLFLPNNTNTRTDLDVLFGHSVDFHTDKLIVGLL